MSVSAHMQGHGKYIFVYIEMIHFMQGHGKVKILHMENWDYSKSLQGHGKVKILYMENIFLAEKRIGVLMPVLYTL